MRGKMGVCVTMTKANAPSSVRKRETSNPNPKYVQCCTCRNNVNNRGKKVGGPELGIYAKYSYSPSKIVKKLDSFFFHLFCNSRRNRTVSTVHVQYRRNSTNSNIKFQYLKTLQSMGVGKGSKCSQRGSRPTLEGDKLCRLVVL